MTPSMFPAIFVSAIIVLSVLYLATSGLRHQWRVARYKKVYERMTSAGLRAMFEEMDRKGGITAYMAGLPAAQIEGFEKFLDEYGKRLVREEVEKIVVH